MPKKALKTTIPRFWHAPGTAPHNHTRNWVASNCALAGLLNDHLPVLKKARAVAVDIRHGLNDLRPVMAGLCRRTCRFCPEPCCITNTVWIDFRDLLLMHLLDAPLPSRQAATDSGDACPFLRHNGCRLPWRIRPWMCVKYLCPAQRTILKKKGRPFSAALYANIDRIEKKRFRLEAEVISRIKPKMPTASSSSSAYSG